MATITFHYDSQVNIDQFTCLPAAEKSVQLYAAVLRILDKQSYEASRMGSTRDQKQLEDLSRAVYSMQAIQREMLAVLGSVSDKLIKQQTEI